MCQRHGAHIRSTTAGAAYTAFETKAKATKAAAVEAICGDLHIQHLAGAHRQLTDHVGARAPVPSTPAKPKRPGSPAAPIALTRTLLTPGGTVNDCSAPVEGNVSVTVGGVAAADVEAASALAASTAPIAPSPARARRRGSLDRRAAQLSGLSEWDGSLALKRGCAAGHGTTPEV